MTGPALIGERFISSHCFSRSARALATLDSCQVLLLVSDRSAAVFSTLVPWFFPLEAQN